jgi:hypothetical protein
MKEHFKNKKGEDGCTSGSDSCVINGISDVLQNSDTEQIAELKKFCKNPGH